jgi:MerR family copper efflux transcriptional regulator
MKTIGTVANEIGVSTHTLRYYEKAGLLESVNRTESGKRLYDERAINQIKFIKRAQRMHFSLDEIKQFIRLDQVTITPKPEVRKLVNSKLSVINKELEELSALKASLETLLDSCQSSTNKESCPILNQLKDDL